MNGLGQHIREARLGARVSQAALARRTGIPRLRIVRFEKGLLQPKVGEFLKIADSLRVPVKWLIDGPGARPGGLRHIAHELYQLGLTDLIVQEPEVPGIQRRPEELLALALQGDRPEPRVVNAIPALLAWNQLNVPLLLAFADLHDPRVRNRLGWLADVTQTIHKLRSFPGGVASEAQLGGLVAARDPDAPPDSLGYPTAKPASPVWRRWGITYAGTLDEFHDRAKELHEGTHR